MSRWRGVLVWLLSPLARCAARHLRVDDPWERQPGGVLKGLFGSGLRRDFGWFFEGQSVVHVQSFDGMHEWLVGCEYVPDQELFQEREFWQHPRTFEQIRKGDCEDFALWAWRKLLEMGYDAEFVVGRRVSPDSDGGGKGGRHAWIVFRRDGGEFVYEPTRRSRLRAVRPLEVVRHEYNPELGVGANRRPFTFGGYYLTARQKLLKTESVG